MLRAGACKRLAIIHREGHYRHGNQLVGVSIMILCNTHIGSVGLHYYAILVRGLKSNLSENVSYGGL